MPKRTWTDSQLRELVASSNSWSSVLRGLGLSLRGRNHVRITRRARELELDTDHFAHARRAAHDDALRAAISSSSNFEVVMEKLGVEQNADSRQRLIARARTLGLSTSHYTRPQVPRSRHKTRRWSDDQLRSAAAVSISYAEVIRKLGLVAAGGNYEIIRRRMFELAIDTTHFKGKAWNAGWKFDPRPPATPLEAVLVAGRWTPSHELKLRLFRVGLKQEACELCGWAERALDGRLPLELDHINGDRNDNRLENLRVLCPNCHALQPTHRGLNQRRRKL